MFDIEEFGSLVVKYQKRVYEMAYSYTRNVDDAYDLSQEIFVKALKSIYAFKGESRFYTWLYRISQNTCIDYVRKRNRFHLVEIEDGVLSSEPKMFTGAVKSLSPTRKVELEELEKEIEKAVRQLPVRQKRAFILHYYEGKSLKEISKIMECQLGTVKAHLFHSTRRLRQLLTSYVEN